LQKFVHNIVFLIKTPIYQQKIGKKIRKTQKSPKMGKHRPKLAKNRRKCQKLPKMSKIAVNWQKSTKIVIITSTPGETERRI
jgi:plasmid stabilization system protein ParE